ncbi:MAG TPA: ATP-binding protein, partial [Candidatus Sulfotelmatobacter sp.]|nr:ATP-binding protein [Candidatus Sulfotelmatobacter sp.]
EQTAIQNLTERRRAEEAVERARQELGEQQRVLATLMSNLPGMAYRCRNDREWTMEFLSEGCLGLTGYTPFELGANRKVSYGDLIHPEDRQRVWEEVQMALQRHERFELVYRILAAEGAEKWVWERGMGVFAAEGELLALEGFVTDITVQRQAQEALRISEERFRSVWERCVDGMRLTDAEGRILAVNEAYCRLVKRPREALVGELFSVTYKSHGPNDGMEVYRRRFATGEIVPRLAARAQLWNAEEVELEISNSFIELGQQGKVILSIFRDASERKALEEQLRQSQKMEAVGRLAGGVAHDFNNLLLVIMGNAELALAGNPKQSPQSGKEESPAAGEREEGIPNQRVVECLKQISGAAERAASLTRQLLAFSRKQVMQSQPLLLNEVVANLTKMLNRIIGEPIDLRCESATPLPYVQADAGMMEQVLVNLVVNARDAMPQGGQLQLRTEKVSVGELEARFNPEARVGDFVCLTVRDTGSGIAPEHLPRIFEPFFTTKELGQGTGLGLATVYGIVKQHRGWIEVASHLGEGTTFRVYLPVIPSPAGQAAAAATQAPLPGGSETLLLVEDDKAVRAITRRVLESVGYKVQEATCAREALEIWNQCPAGIQMLLTDIVMPEGISGRELCERLRHQRSDLKVVLMSGYSAEVSGKDTEFFRRTQSYFLQKPCSSRMLLETVRRCLDGNPNTLNGVKG